MWQVVCVGPGPMDRVRRVEDRGPLHPDQARVNSIAAMLRATGLYESVKVVGSMVKPAAVVAGSAPDNLSFNPSDMPEPPKAEKSLDDLSAMIDDGTSPDSATSEPA